MSHFSDLVSRAAVSRFLGVEPEEVQRMVNEDGLPIVKIPGPTRPSVRVFLPDLQEWLVKRSPGCGRLADFNEFRKAFLRSQEEIRV